MMKIELGKDEAIVEINLNKQVETQLTDKGESVLRQYWKPYGDGKIPYWLWTDKEQRIIKIELWMLMQIFGGDLCNGCDIPFVDNKLTFRDPE